MEDYFSEENPVRVVEVFIDELGSNFRRLQDRQIGRMLIQHSWNKDTPLMRGSSPPLATGHDANTTASRRSDARSS
jgi:hypothetical protein